jgi:hypothetical protein
VIAPAAISRAANAPTMQRFIVVSRHNAAGECRRLGWQDPSTAWRQSSTLPLIYLVFAAFRVVIPAADK